MSCCSVEGCGKPVYVAGMCSPHYNRKRTTGTTDDGPRARKPLSERLWKYVTKRGPDECWNWFGKSMIRGYGLLGIGGRKDGKMLAHRVSWILANGPIPEGGPEPHGYVVMHTCDNRLCCNPAHLRLGTQYDNIEDMNRKGRHVPRGPSTDKDKSRRKQNPRIEAP